MTAAMLLGIVSHLRSARTGPCKGVMSHGAVRLSPRGPCLVTLYRGQTPESSPVERQPAPSATEVPPMSAAAQQHQLSCPCQSACRVVCARVLDMPFLSAPGADACRRKSRCQQSPVSYARVANLSMSVRACLASWRKVQCLPQGRVWGSTAGQLALRMRGARAAKSLFSLRGG
jgi:hypothetical protein